MKCKNCNHIIEELAPDSFIQKYKDKNLWCHKRHRWNRFNPLRECHCGCRNPQPIKTDLK